MTAGASREDAYASDAERLHLLRLQPGPTAGVTPSSSRGGALVREATCPTTTTDPQKVPRIPLLACVAMPSRWEYMAVAHIRDWSSPGFPNEVWVWGPHDSDGSQVPTGEGFSILRLLDDLGSEGWELVGPPAHFNLVGQVAVRASDGAPSQADGAYWHRREFWLKRAVET